MFDAISVSGLDKGIRKGDHSTQAVTFENLLQFRVTLLSEPPLALEGLPRLFSHHSIAVDGSIYILPLFIPYG